MTISDSDPDSFTLAQARAVLSNNGLPFSQRHFLRHIRDGNTAIVKTYLKAGMCPNAKVEGETALAAAANVKSGEIVEILIQNGAVPGGIVEGLSLHRSKKDVWEIVSSLGGIFTFISSLTIAGIGAYFTHSYNSAQITVAKQQAERDAQSKDYQNRIAEMQTVEKLIPHLIKDDSSKKAALIAIGELASPKVGRALAVAYANEGGIEALSYWASTGTKSNVGPPAVAALTEIAKTEAKSDAKPAREALTAILEKSRSSMIVIASSSDQTYKICNGIIVNGKLGLIAAPSFCIPKGGAKDTTIEFHDGSVWPAERISTGKNGLISILQTAKKNTQELPLSDKKFAKNDVALLLTRNLLTNSPSILVGKVTDTGVMPFIDARSSDFTRTIAAHGYRIQLENGKTNAFGTGGSPYFDSEGKAVCMEFQGYEQIAECIAVKEILLAANAAFVGGPAM
ncbi:ankyrin repeat domain-containing protein [Pseudoduganella namucuonensis]|uniref:Uncharacterized protein n=1 Tax=Pseudoduganella namucuonensis TaxID=1035707 RepID=A0A1I7L788_9BURK|nr:ankyrin repeat domain-containing protein [Pseudoduganella namucuonensis]SFV05563.1 hypothetical protein SAMN05216552_102427 [Pseudoduganella namucuonensis]